MSGSGISCAICKSAPRSRQITMPAPHHSVFYRPDDLPATQPTASKHWRKWIKFSRCELLQDITYTGVLMITWLVWWELAVEWSNLQPPNWGEGEGHLNEKNTVLSSSVTLVLKITTSLTAGQPCIYNNHDWHQNHSTGSQIKQYCKSTDW